VVLGPVDDREVDAVDLQRLGDRVAAEALEHAVAVLGDHVVGCPVYVLLELPVERRVVLRPLPVDGDGVVRLPALDRLAQTDAVAEPLGQIALPQVLRVDHVRVGVEDLEPVLHDTVPLDVRWCATWARRSSSLTRSRSPTRPARAHRKPWSRTRNAAVRGASTWPAAWPASTRRCRGSRPATRCPRTPTATTS